MQSAPESPDLQAPDSGRPNQWAPDTFERLTLGRGVDLFLGAKAAEGARASTGALSTSKCSSIRLAAHGHVDRVSDGMRCRYAVSDRLFRGYLERLTFEPQRPRIRQLAQRPKVIEVATEAGSAIERFPAPHHLVARTRSDPTDEFGYGLDLILDGLDSVGDTAYAGPGAAVCHFRALLQHVRGIRRNDLHR